MASGLAPRIPGLGLSSSLIAALLTLLTLLACTAHAHNIALPAHGRECFHESLRRDDKMTVTFQVGDREFGSAGNLDINFWVRRAPPPPLLTNLNPCFRKNIFHYFFFWTWV